MNDKELLELTALAAGYNIGFFSARNQRGFTCGFTHAKDGGDWNPLDNDGDALRLMVVLRLDILWSEHELSVVVCNDSSNDDPVTEKVRFTADPLAATRYAIVRAAAEIGKSMKVD